MTERNPELIMLVDDSDTDNFINRRVLEISGFTKKIVIKDSGRSALDYLNANQTNTSELPELIFLDINMPIVDGFVFLYEFGEMSQDVRNRCKIIILSSSNNKRDIDRIVDNSYVIDFITKPLSLEAIKEIRANKLFKVNI